MKKKYFTNIFLLAMLILFATSPLQAQSWANHGMMTMHLDMVTYAQTQKIKPYKNDILIGISVDPFTNHYCFNIFRNNSSIAGQLFTNQIGLSLSDFTILGDTLYFCGKKLNNQNNYEGVIGKMSMAALLSGNNIQYNMTSIINTQNLTKLVAYYVNTNEVCVFAIGDNGVSNQIPGRVVLLMDSIGSPNITIDVMSTPFISNTTKEILHDISLSGDAVITLSHVYPNNQYIVRYFRRYNPLHNNYSYKYTLQNITFNTMSDCYGYGLHISDIEQDVLAVAVSASQNNNNFTIVNFLEQFNSTVLSSQAIVHGNKDHKVLEMEYSDALHKLLILHNNYFENIGQKQTLCRLSPIYSSSDTLFLELLSEPNTLNHFSIIPKQRCALIGINKSGVSQANQLFSVRKLELPTNVNCYKYIIGKTILMNFQDGVIETNVSIPTLPSQTTIWGVYYGSSSSDNIYIDCDY